MTEYIVDIDTIWDLFCSGIVYKSEVHESIVRCRDCKYFYQCGPDTLCNHPRAYLQYENTLEVWPNGFCAWGKPKDGGIDG